MSKSSSSKRWLSEHFSDPYVQRAAREGYRSRASYKLLEIQQKDRLLRPGMTVLDLGAAPGGWSQVAARVLGHGGRVVAVDLLAMDPIPGVHFIQGDIRDAALWGQAKEAMAGPVDLILSDMAPNMSGIAAVDQARAMGLAEMALDCAEEVLRLGGALLMKVFMGAGADELRQRLRSRFGRLVVRKPDASRARSAEQYWLASDFRGNA